MGWKALGPRGKRRLWHLLPVGGVVLFGSYFAPWYWVVGPDVTYTGWWLLREIMWSQAPSPILQNVSDLAILWPLLSGALAFFHWTWGSPSRRVMRVLLVVGLGLLAATRAWFGALEVRVQPGIGLAVVGYLAVLTGSWGVGRTRPL